MFGSIVLDVAIGLVLIYLLYSLLVTILGEIISSRIRIRAKMLKTAIEIMLLDDPIVTPSASWIEWIERRWKAFTHQTRLDYKNSLAESFYNYPSIKYLGRKESKKLPSYISKENFADTIFNMLREKGTGADDMAKIDFCLKYNTLNINDETKKHITNLFQTDGADIDAFKLSLQKWFIETMDRLKGWYKLRMQFILFSLGLIIAISFNVDSIKIARLLSKDKDARNQMVQMGAAMAKDTARYHDFIIANGDTLHTQAVIDSGYAHISKDITEANLILGLGWGFDKLRKEKIDTFDIIKDTILIKKIGTINLKSIKPTETKIKTLYGKTNMLSNSIASLNLKKLKSESIIAEKNFWLTLGKRGDSITKKSIDSIVLNIALFKSQISNQSSFAKYYSDSLLKLKAIKNYSYNEIITLTGNKFASIDSIHFESKPFILFGKRNYCWYEKLWLVICGFFSGFLGFFITAIALSLGAPFWFDLLSKLVSIRGSGVNPDKKKTSGNIMDQPPPPNPAANLLAVPPAPTSETPVDIALRIYGDTIKQIKGVVNVAQGYYKEADKVLKCVQINVEDQDTAVRVRSLYDQLRVGENDIVKTNVLITGRPVLSFGSTVTGIKEKGIKNKNFLYGWGSFSCLVKYSYSSEKKYLLTCYHVVNGDQSWNGKPTNRTILNYKDEVISSNFIGYLNIHQDSALVEIDEKTVRFYKSMKNVRLPKSFKEVTEDDIYTKEVFINGYSTTEASGFITHNQWPDTFQYGNITQKIENMILISHVDNNGNLSAISTKSDSGALVIDSDNNALGIVVAGDFLHTYAIKITTILTELGLELIV